MRERATWRIWIVFWLLAALQTTLLARWRPFETDVDWILLSVVSVSILLGWPVGAIYGLVAGWLTGVMRGRLSRLVRHFAFRGRWRFGRFR